MKEKTKKLILFIVVCVLTILVLFTALKLNEIKTKEYLSKSKISGYLTEINYEEISNYVVEQPSIIIYVSNSSEKDSTYFENLFKPIIKKYNLETEIVYININETNIGDQVYQYAPELVIYKNGEISDIIDCTTLDSKNDITNILKERGIIND